MHETQRARRGHQFWPTKDAALPALYGTEGTMAPDKIIRAHYFVGGCEWWLIELDPDGTAFGYACLNDPDNAEWGYLDLVGMEGMRVQGHVIERDMHWQPTAVRDAKLPGRAS